MLRKIDCVMIRVDDLEVDRQRLGEVAVAGHRPDRRGGASVLHETGRADRERQGRHSTIFEPLHSEGSEAARSTRR